MPFDFSKKLSKAFSFGGLKKDTAGVVGIDIGSSSIKVVQLKNVRGVATLETYGELQLGPYANVEIGRATNLDAKRLSEALVDIVREASVSSKRVALGIPYSSSFVTVITLPVANEGQLASMVPIEARKYIPVPMGEVTLDWFAIPDARGTNREEKNKHAATRVLLAAIHNEALSKYQAVMQNAALSASFVEIEAFSTIRSVANGETEAVMLVDIGAATTKLYLVRNGIIAHTHSINIGSQDMTLSLSQALELSVDDAEELKRQVGLLGNNDERIARSIRFSLDRLMHGMERIVSSYENKTSHAIEKIILTGGGGLLHGLPEEMSAFFKRDVILADPFAKVAHPAFLEDTLKEAGPSFVVAMGVALRKLNEK